LLYTLRMGIKRVAHGLSKTREYRIWATIKQRCTNPAVACYRHYGGRGVTMCDLWLKSFMDFYKEVGPSPGKQYRLDRIDNSRGYEPGNVRWATQRDNCNNTRRNVWITLDGETHTVAQWSRKLGILNFSIFNRINRGVTDPRDILSTKPLGNATHISIKERS